MSWRSKLNLESPEGESMEEFLAREDAVLMEIAQRLSVNPKNPMVRMLRENVMDGRFWQEKKVESE
jgi:hypothetical protein